MNALPLQSIYMSDFRRLSGHHTIELNAPIVLLHGANGAGKTSILSALEMGLTGQIRSMRRQDSRYTAYLPHIGHEFATIRVEVADDYAAKRNSGPIAVGGSRIEGAPALDAMTAIFFSERCYLDQVSLGQLLELYQYTEGREESALARFINELLGLEQLDALRAGLDHAGDWRRLKHLSELLDAAVAAKDRAVDALVVQTADLEKATGRLSESRNDLVEALVELGARPSSDDDEVLLELAAGVAEAQPSAEDQDQAAHLFRQLVALNARASVAAESGSAQHLEEAHTKLQAAEAAYQEWHAEGGVRIRSVESRCSALGLAPDDDPLESATREIQVIDQSLKKQSNLVEVELPEAREALDRAEARMDAVARALAAEQEQAGQLVEGLSALRAYVAENGSICPICDRDYSEVSRTTLGEHLDQKLSALAARGERLHSLRVERDAAIADAAHTELRLSQISAQVLDDEGLLVFRRRLEDLVTLRQALIDLQPTVQQGSELLRGLKESRELADRLDETATELRRVTTELSGWAETLGQKLPADNDVVMSSQLLLTAAEERLNTLQAHSTLAIAVASAAERFAGARTDLEQATQHVAKAAQRRGHWEDRLVEARRRQAVAREVHRAAETARNEVVHHVFTESLNQLWQSVFARLAPREQYIPTFGEPSASRSALELRLQTLHVSGAQGGAPQIMLSAGNLNTAALSLFLALHLAVEPRIPCLVFDDPVQAMDEVHVAQFAGLIRMLSKHHKRQILIAVHERELFDYLSLELSPAFNGDELLTIELGERGNADDLQVTRHSWRPDLAIAT